MSIRTVLLISLSALITGTSVHANPVPYQELDQLPDVVAKQPLHFPDRLQSGDLPGLVRLWLKVLPNGEIDRIRVLTSTHPFYTDSALDMLLRTRFQPLTKAGLPVATGFPVQVRFPSQRGGSARGGEVPYEVIRVSDIASIAEGNEDDATPVIQFFGNAANTDASTIGKYRTWEEEKKALQKASQIFSFRKEVTEGRLTYDTPPVVSLFSVPIFPTSNLLQGPGKKDVSVSWLIDASGIPFNPNAADGDRSPFARSVEAAVRYWRFVPALRDGEPVTSLQAYSYSFNRFRREGELRKIAQDIESGAIPLQSPADLDRPLRPRVVRDIVFPHVPEKAKGQALIKVVLNPEGRIILPEIVETDNEDLAWSVIAGLVQWRFDPPTVNGQPVYTVFQQNFRN